MPHIRPKTKEIFVSDVAQRRSIVSWHVKRRVAAGTAILIVAAIGTAAAQLARDRSNPARPMGQASPPQALPQEYAVLLTRSIFAKSGRSAGPGILGRGGSEGDSGGTARASESSPESRWAFRGVFREGPRLIAFLEDLTSRKTYRLKVGDPVARGRVAEITIDQLWYQVGDKRSAVGIGQTLDGSTVAVSAPPTTRPTDASGRPAEAVTGTAAAAQPPTAATTAEERMRLRRQQEGGR